MFVGAATLGSSLRAGATLLAFYMSSSKLTTLKEELKEVDEEFKKGGSEIGCRCGSPCSSKLSQGVLHLWSPFMLPEGFGA